MSELTVYLTALPQRLRGLEDVLRGAVVGALVSGEVERGEISLTIADDDFVAALHERYRGVSGPTDVLAFSLDSGPRVTGLIGDIYVSLDRAEVQAVERGISIGEEVVRLVIHGALHLVGFRDDTPKRRRELERRQEELVARYWHGSHDG